MEGEEAAWAREEFGKAKLGDSRRVERVVRMGAQVAKKPAGKVTEVFAEDAERQGAYDFLESKHISSLALLAALGSAALGRGAGDEYVYAPVDGSSLGLTDRAGGKDFGSVGSLRQRGRGLKVISAIGVDPQGVPLGLLSQVYWARQQARSSSRKDKRKHNRKRRVVDKETQRWIDTIEQTTACASEAGAELWFELDREADNQHILWQLDQSGHRFTVRSSWDRLLESSENDKQYLRQRLKREQPGGHYEMEVSAGPHRTARTAHMVVRWCSVKLLFRDKWTHATRSIEVRAVWAREEETAPQGEKALDWLLLTNAPVDTFEQAQHIVRGYTFRWVIEEFHKTWKSGATHVEQTQLRTRRAVIVWATILASVALRIERLKKLARSTPELPASVELTRYEIRALILLKRQIKKRTETIPDTMPSIGQATVWIAELGGYTGKSSGGPPGSITIRRGLDELRPAARLLQVLEAQGRLLDEPPKARG